MCRDRSELAEVHRAVGPLVAFLLTQLTALPSQVLSVVWRLFLNVYFSLLIKVNQLLLCYFGFAKRPTIKECCMCY